MPTNDKLKTGLQFVRDFYRGSSAYADYVPAELLSVIHLETKLDDAIVASAMAGKDIVLTGNPGDGKTHIIRLLKQRLESSGKPIKIILDASTLLTKIFMRNGAKHDRQAFHLSSLSMRPCCTLFTRSIRISNPLKMPISR